MTSQHEAEALVEQEPWSWSRLEDFRELGKPPGERIQTLRALCEHDEMWVAYRSAAILAALGEEDGITWFLRFMNTRDGSQEVVYPHRLWGHEDYDAIANYARLFGMAGGSSSAEAAVYRYLLGICHRFEMAINLPVALELSPVTPVIRNELLTAVKRGIVEGKTDLIQPLLPALVLVAPVEGSQIVHKLVSDPTVENFSHVGNAIGELRTRAATAWARELAASEEAVLNITGTTAVERIENRAADSSCEWWRNRWSTSWLGVASRLVGREPRCAELTRIAACLWGGDTEDVDLDALRRAVLTGYPELNSTWSQSDVCAVLEGIDHTCLSPTDLFEVTIVGTLMGASEARGNLDTMLSDLISGSSHLLPNPEFDTEDAFDEIAGAVYVYAQERGEWDAFETTIRVLLSNFSRLGSVTKLGAAVLDGQSAVLLPQVESAFRDARDGGSLYAASKLLPAMMRWRSENRWADVESLLGQEPEPLDPSIFAAISLAYDPGERATAVSERLVEHANDWTVLFAEDALSTGGM